MRHRKRNRAKGTLQRLSRKLSWRLRIAKIRFRRAKSALQHIRKFAPRLRKLRDRESLLRARWMHREAARLVDGTRLVKLRKSR